MTQSLNTSDRKFVHIGMKECTSLLDVVSENIDTADLNSVFVVKTETDTFPV